MLQVPLDRTHVQKLPKERRRWKKTPRTFETRLLDSNDRVHTQKHHLQPWRNRRRSNPRNDERRKPRRMCGNRTCSTQQPQSNALDRGQQGFSVRPMTAAIARPPPVSLSNRFEPLSTRIDMDDLHRVTPDIRISLLAHSNSPSIYLNTTLFGKRDTAAAKALIDSGATGNLINTEFVKTHRIPRKPLKSPLRVRMADDSEGLITHFIDIGLEISDGSSEH